MRHRHYWILSLACCVGAAPLSLARAQEGYEFEVYGADLAPRGATELELQSNVVTSGSTTPNAELRPTDHAVRSSLELSHSFTDWLNGGFYTVGYARSGNGASYVGNRARLTTVIPGRWHAPLRFGLSQELSYARSGFAESEWTYEVTPIIAAYAHHVSLTLNPSLEQGFGQGEHELEFEPHGSVGYHFDDGDEDDGVVALEYYSVLGPVDRLDPSWEQRHQLFARAQVPVGSRWSVGLGVGRGFTRSSDRYVIATRLEFHPGS